MKKIWIESATLKDFAEIEIGDWLEGVGLVTTHWEKLFIRNYGELHPTITSRRDALRIGITQQNVHNDQEGDISNAAWRLFVRQGMHSLKKPADEKNKSKQKNTPHRY